MNSDEKWKNHLIWEHGMKNLFPKQYTHPTLHHQYNNIKEAAITEENPTISSPSSPTPISYDRRFQPGKSTLDESIPYNRYYHRGSSPSGVGAPSCCKNYLEYNRKYGTEVLSSNNPYANDNPSFAQYLIYSIYGDRVLTLHDINTITQYFNKHIAISDAERLYGPFNQLNLNIISETAYNYQNWKQGWRGYHHWNNLNLPIHPDTKVLPALYQVAHKSAVDYMKAMNRVLGSLGINTYMFQLAKHKVKQILRSTQTHYIKYTLNVALTRNPKAKAYVFEILVYYDPVNNKIILGKTTFLGSGTTDNILLPPGKDPRLFDTGVPGAAGRPLHPLRAKQSELMLESEVNDLFWQHMYATRHPTQNIQYTDELPFWHRSRHGRAKTYPHKMGYGSIAAMYSDKSPEQTQCMDCL